MQGKTAVQAILPFRHANRDWLDAEVWNAKHVERIEIAMKARFGWFGWWAGKSCDSCDVFSSTPRHGTRTHTYACIPTHICMYVCMYVLQETEMCDGRTAFYEVRAY
jgi:hypothetical protein